MYTTVGRMTGTGIIATLGIITITIVPSVRVVRSTPVITTYTAV
jgi:hypothetical protein